MQPSAMVPSAPTEGTAGQYGIQHNSTWPD